MSIALKPKTEPNGNISPIFNRVYAKTKKEASKRSFERIVRRSFHFIGSLKLLKSEKLPN